MDGAARRRASKEGDTMATRWISWIPTAAVAVVGMFAQPARGAGPTSCKIEFNLKGWSAIYETASGTGKIKCSNGQTARVSLKSKGGGLTFGKMKIVDGIGTFSEVVDISEVFGEYAVAETDAALGKSADAQVLTKGNVSLALAGKGKGVELGFDFGKFTITKEK
jgi:hypothetical protein